MSTFHSPGSAKFKTINFRNNIKDSAKTETSAEVASRSVFVAKKQANKQQKKDISGNEIKETS